MLVLDLLVGGRSSTGSIVALLGAPLGAAAGEALFRNRVTAQDTEPNYTRSIVAGGWGLLGAVFKHNLLLCNFGIGVATSLTVGFIGAMSYFNSSDDSSCQPSIIRDMGIAFFVGYVTSASVRGVWRPIG